MVACGVQRRLRPRGPHPHGPRRHLRWPRLRHGERRRGPRHEPVSRRRPRLPARRPDRPRPWAGLRIQRPSGAGPLRQGRPGPRSRRARPPAAGGREGRDRGALPAHRGRRHPDHEGAGLLRGRDPDARPHRLRRPPDGRQPPRGDRRGLRGDLPQRVREGGLMYTQTRHYPMYVAGGWTEGAPGARSEATSPATGEVIGTVPEGDREDVRRAVAAANAAAPAWASLSAFDRSAAMDRIAGIITGRREDLARTLSLDQGKPLEAEAYEEVDELIAYFEMAAADAIRFEGSMPPSVDANKRILLYRVPRGVVGVISPWNWPYTMPAELIAPALACGNAVVWTPAPTTSVCAAKLAECIVEADLPAGVFNMVTGPGPVVGDEVAANPSVQAVGFIGSGETGRKG